MESEPSQQNSAATPLRFGKPSSSASQRATSPAISCASRISSRASEGAVRQLSRNRPDGLSARRIS